MSEETTKTLIQNLPQILTALGVLVTAIFAGVAALYSKRSSEQSKTNAANIEAVQKSLRNKGV